MKQKTQRVDVIRTNAIVAHDTVVEADIESVSLEEWKEFGCKLKAAERYVQWYLGYWWNYGHKKWTREAGDFIQELGYSRQTLQHYGSVYRLVKPCIRVQDLPFKHHQLVAPFKPQRQRHWLKKASENNWSVKELRNAIVASQVTNVKLPDDIFDIIYADPPWRYDFSASDNRRIEKEYPTLELSAICNFRDSDGREVKEIIAENACLYLWATAPKLIQALQVMEAWGFEYTTNMVWVKDKIGMGYWARQQHEHLLIGKRGNIKPPAPPDRRASVIVANRTAHSRKPIEVYEMIENQHPLSTGHKWCEIFGREQRANWYVVGNQL